MTLEMVEVAWERAAYPEPISQPIGGRCLLLGWSVRETSGGTAATVLLLNGADAGGLEAVGISLNPAGAARDWLGPNGLHMDVGVFPVIAGAVAGSVWVWRGWAG